MMRKKIVFCDTNILFGVFRRLFHNLPLSHSVLFSLSSYHDIYISEYVLSELVMIFHREHDITITHALIEMFFSKS